MTAGGKREYAKLKARLIALGEEYRAVAENAVTELAALEKQTVGAIARAHKETRRISEALENAWPGEELASWFTDYMDGGEQEQEYDRLEKLFEALPGLDSGPGTDDVDLYGAIEAYRKIRSAAQPFLKAAERL